MISVVMATYNGEHYLREQLLSISNQTCKPDEIVISDDNSSDSTQTIIQSFIDETEIPVYYTSNSEQIGYARNFRKALSLSHGDIIFFSDQDDIWEKDKVEKCVSFFEAYPDALALSTAYRLIDDNGNPKKENIMYHSFSVKRIKKIKWKTFIKHPKYPGMAMAIRRELIEDAVLLNKLEDIPHDWLFNEVAAWHGRMYFWNVVLTNYRIHYSNTVGITVGSLINQNVDGREKLLSDIMQSLISIVEYHEDKRAYLNKVINFQKRRMKLYVEKKTWCLFLYDFTHLNYISFRSLAGDLYMGIKRKMK